MNILIEPFHYDYMIKAILVSSLIGALCAFLSCYVMLKGWSLIADSLSHSIVPGVVISYILGFSFSIGAFFSGILSALAMLFINKKTKLKEDTIMGFVFSSFFALALFLVSIFPSYINIQTIIFGNILAIDSNDTYQILIISIISFIILLFKWKDLILIFFDEIHAYSLGLRVFSLKLLFFSLLSIATIASLQTVGSFLIICMIITPGATSYLLSDNFYKIIIISVIIGVFTSFIGAYLSYFLNGATGGVIILSQIIIFLLVFLFAPKYGLLKNFRR